MFGAFVGAKAHVLDFISTFDQFGFLWKQDLATEYASFMATHPTLEVLTPASAHPELDAIRVRSLSVLALHEICLFLKGC